MIRIIIHTLAAHAHVCDRYSKPYTGFAARSRDMSQLSLEEEEGRDHHTHQNQTPQGETHADEEPDIETADVNKDSGTDKCTIILSKQGIIFFAKLQSHH